MELNYQCSNCGKRFMTKPVAGAGHGLYFSGARAVGDAFYCEDCVRTWKDRNGKEFDVQYRDPFGMFANWWNNEIQKQKGKSDLIKTVKFAHSAFYDD